MYYVNHSTGQSTFDRNDPMIPKVAPAPAPASPARSTGPTEAQVKTKYQAMSLMELRRACTQKGLSSMGAKDQIVSRLVDREKPAGGWGGATSSYASASSGPTEAQAKAKYQAMTLMEVRRACTQKGMSQVGMKDDLIRKLVAKEKPAGGWGGSTLSYSSSYSTSSAARPSGPTEGQVKGKYLAMALMELRRACTQKGLSSMGAKDQIVSRLVDREKPAGGWGGAGPSSLSGGATSDQHRFMSQSDGGQQPYHSQQQYGAPSIQDYRPPEPVYVEPDWHQPQPPPVRTVRSQKIVVGHVSNPFPAALAWTRGERQPLEMPAEYNNVEHSIAVDELVGKEWALELRDGCLTDDRSAPGMRMLASWSRGARDRPRPAWDDDAEPEQNWLNKSLEERPTQWKKSAAAMNRLGRPWKAESKVDSGLWTNRSGSPKKKAAAVDRDDLPPKDERAVVTMEAVLEWDKRCNRGAAGSGGASDGMGGVRPWGEKREWERSDSPLASLRHRARAVVKQTKMVASSSQKEAENPEDVKLWQEQMATNYKDGNLDLADLADVSSLPTLLKLLKIDDSALRADVLGTVAKIAPTADALPDSEEWESLLNLLLDLVEPEGADEKPQEKVKLKADPKPEAQPAKADDVKPESKADAAPATKAAEAKPAATQDTKQNLTKKLDVAKSQPAPEPEPEPELEASKNGVVGASVRLDYKRQVIKFLQLNSDEAFQKKHGLKGEIPALRKRRNKQELSKAYTEWSDARKKTAAGTDDAKNKSEGLSAEKLKEMQEIEKWLKDDESKDDETEESPAKKTAVKKAVDAIEAKETSAAAKPEMKKAAVKADEKAKAKAPGKAPGEAEQAAAAEAKVVPEKEKDEMARMLERISQLEAVNRKLEFQVAGMPESESEPEPEPEPEVKNEAKDTAAQVIEAAPASSDAGLVSGWQAFRDAEAAFSQQSWSAAATKYAKAASAAAATAAIAGSISQPSLWRCYNRLGLSRSRMAKAAATAGGAGGGSAAKELNIRALQDYTNAIEVDGSRAESYSNRGWKHLTAGDLDAAQSDAYAALARDEGSRSGQQLLQKVVAIDMSAYAEDEWVVVFYSDASEFTPPRPLRMRDSNANHQLETGLSRDGATKDESKPKAEAVDAPPVTTRSFAEDAPLKPPEKSPVQESPSAPTSSARKPADAAPVRRSGSFLRRGGGLQASYGIRRSGTWMQGQ